MKKLEMKHTVNIVIELVTPLPCAAYLENDTCRNEANKALGTMTAACFWEIVPLCNDCWERVKPDLISD